MRILGLSCDYHDAAAALVVDGKIIAAAEEERFSRVKHDSSLPERAIASCLAIGGVEADALDAVVFHEKPLAVVSRVLAARQRRGPGAINSFARDFPVLLKRNVMVGYRTEKALRRMGASTPPPLRYSEHHLSHASAAFYPSPFDTAAILTIDGIGEWETATVGQGLHHRVDLLEEQRFPNSFGLAYSLATVWCGFEANDGEYKLMGLAPFGEPRYIDALEEVIALDDDGSMRVDGAAVKWWGGNPKKMSRLVELFDGPPRRTRRGSHPTRRRPGAIGPGLRRDGGAANGPTRPGEDGRDDRCVSPAALPSTASPTGDCSARDPSTRCGSSRRRVTPAAPSAPLCGTGTTNWATGGRLPPSGDGPTGLGDSMSGAALGPTIRLRSDRGVARRARDRPRARARCPEAM